ncbi:MAG: glycine dehydrogenase (aminomethyl-transferring), partial [Oscillatoria sp. PMC 1076.18]|nr:glycine dehydrogenase (aminomethyl-transferring) [Oscillatoria sp. PMC 1076.18]
MLNFDLAANQNNSELPEAISASDSFVSRHLGPNENEVQEMLQVLGFSTLDQLIESTIPAGIRFQGSLNLPEAKSESAALKQLQEIAAQNLVSKSFIGMGYYDCFTPPVIQRNILENPGWYTAYTPYQAEVAQGRLEALLNFQTMIIQLTGLEIANASLLDEATAAAEAMSLSYAVTKSKANAFFVADDCHPQVIEVVQTRAQPLGIEVIVGSHQSFDFQQQPIFGALLQYPATDGAIYDYRQFVEKAHQVEAVVTVAADLLSLALLVPPGEFGADIAVGSTQRFGVPLGYGGPHAAYFATREAYKRQVPGRIVGVSKDKTGKPALRLALQTREQHIRRDRATSNICTAQVLLAVIASMYAVYHGAEGIQRIAQKVHNLTAILATGLQRLGYKTNDTPVFDTLRIETNQADAILAAAEREKINLRWFDRNALGISLDETTTVEDIVQLWQIFAGKEDLPFTVAEIAAATQFNFESKLARRSKYLRDSVFNTHHSETEILRYLHQLQAKDLSLTTSMIPL